MVNAVSIYLSLYNICAKEINVTKKLICDIDYKIVSCVLLPNYDTLCLSI